MASIRFAGVIALLLIAAPAHAQHATTWRAGLVVGIDDDGTGAMVHSLGGTVQADRAIVTKGGASLGVIGRFTSTVSINGECVSVWDPCTPRPRAHLQWFAGAGPSLAFERGGLGASRLFARAALIAGRGVVADIPHPSPVRVAFSSLMMDAGLGVRWGRTSLEVEYTRGGMKNVSHAEWGLVMGWRARGT